MRNYVQKFKNRIMRQAKRCSNCHHLYDPRSYHNCPSCYEDVPYYVRVYNR